MHHPRPSSERSDLPRVLMVGPPNVGKSVLFNRLTGISVNMANYPGTTVTFTEGPLQLDTRRVVLVDAPGTYTLGATNEAEQVTVTMLVETPDLVVAVLDAVNLESSLFLLFQILQHRLPTVVVINRVDLLADRGVAVDFDAFTERLELPVMAAVAVTGEGVEDFRVLISEGLSRPPISGVTMEPKWEQAEDLANDLLQPATGAVRDWRKRIGDRLVRPWPGLLLGILLLAGALAVIIGVGMGLRRWILLPIFREWVIPGVAHLVQQVIPPGLMREVIIGEYGFLNKGLEWPFTLVMPYVLSFNLVLSVLEDSGYMPRLGVLLDGLLNKIGLTGSGIVPLLLGYGCGIPAIMATRTLETAKQRLMVAMMVSLSVPCIAQSGAFISLLAERSIGALLAVIAFSIIALVFAGWVMDRMIPGDRPATVMEIPELLAPRGSIIAKKLWVRTRHFISDGALPMMIAVGVAAVLYETDAMLVFGRVMRPIVTGWLRLPEEAAVPLLLGIFRRELAVLPLIDMNLSALQLFVGAIVGLYYVPCIAMIAVLAREFDLRFAAIVLIGTTVFALLMGGVAARVGALLF